MRWKAAHAIAVVGVMTGMSLVSPAFAEDVAQEPVEAKQVVISPNKTEQPISQVNSAVEVITGEEMEAKKLKTVVDALRLAQGVAVFSNGGPGGLAEVRMRGAFARHTLVLIDGAIANSPTSGTFNFANLTTENIERMEILRGAQGMMYGSDAMGGVVNIITKRGRGTPTASAFIEYGSFASLREGAQVSGSKGVFDFAASLSRWDTSNFSTVNYRRGAGERDPFHNWNASSRLGVTLPRDGRLEFNLRWMNSDFHTDGTNAAGAADEFGARQTTRTLFGSASYEQPLTNWWSQKLTVAQGNEHILGSSGPVQRDLSTGALVPTSIFSTFVTDIEYLNRRLEWQHNLQLHKMLSVIAGYQFREEQGDNPNAFGGGTRRRIISSHAGFAQGQFNYKDRLLFTAGVRQDSYNVFGDATTYRVTGGYLIPETRTKIRSTYATGFRAPTLNDLYFTSAFFVGNPNLKPEKSRSFDVGVDQTLFKERLMLSLTYFWNRYNNLIANDLATNPITTINIDEAKTQGWEAGFRFLIFKGLEARGQYTYTLTRDLRTGRRLPRWPIDQASVGLSYQPIEPVQIHLDYRFVGERFGNATNVNSQKQGDFGVVNLAGTYDVTNRFQVFGRVDNLLDQKYEEILGFGTPIRSVYGGIKITL